MQGRKFLDVATELAANTTEAHWRSAVGRAYYALFLEGREALRRWGFSIPSRNQVHAFVRLRFSYATLVDLKRIGDILDRLVQYRNLADYDLASSPHFVTNVKAKRAVADATNALGLLDPIDADPARQAAAIAEIRAAWP